MKSLLSLLMLIFTVVTSYGQTPIWENNLPFATHFLNLTRLSDGSIVAAGTIQTPPEYPTRIVKYSEGGGFIWQFSGRVQHTGESDIQETANGKLVYAAALHKFAAPNEPNKADAYLQQINATTGDTSSCWSQSFTYPYTTDWSTELLVMPDGDLVTAGVSFDREPGQGLFDYYFLRRTDSLGNEIWYRRFAKNACTYGTRLLLNSSGNFVLAGFTCRPANIAPVHPFLMEISPAGDSLRAKTVIVKSAGIMEELNRGFNNIIQTKDGNYVFSGVFSSSSSGYAGFIAKVDTAFNLLWYYEDVPTNSAGARASRVAELPDSTLLFMNKDVVQMEPPYLVRLSRHGQFISRTNLYSAVCPQGQLLPYDWTLLPDSSIAVCGTCIGSPSLAYIGRFGNLTFPPVVSAEDQLQKLQVQLYPNPARQQVTIQLSGGATTGIMYINSVTGQQVLEQPLTAAQTQVPLKGLLQGLYLYRVLANGQVVNGKLVVE